MKHQPYEDWMLSGRRLSRREQTEMHLHLRQCLDCRQLHAGVVRADAVLRRAAVVQPAPGFVTRWRIRQVSEEESRRGRLAWWTFAWTTLGAAPLALALTWHAVVLAGSLPALLAQVLLSLIRWWTWLRLTAEIARAIVVSLPGPAAMGVLLWWQALLAAAGSLGVAWSALMLRYSFQGGRR